MFTVLSVLRTIICMGVALLVWFVLARIVGIPATMIGVLVPVWLGGLTGGVVSMVFNLRQGLNMAVTAGVLLMAGFLWYRHGVVGLGLGENTFITLWPVWFPAAFYVGAYGYLYIVVSRGRS